MPRTQEHRRSQPIHTTASIREQSLALSTKPPLKHGVTFRDSLRVGLLLFWAAWHRKSWKLFSFVYDMNIDQI